MDGEMRYMYDSLSLCNFIKYSIRFRDFFTSLFLFLKIDNLFRKYTMDRYSFRNYINDIFIETGSGNGDGIQAALNAGFQKIISFEIEPSFVEKVKLRFKEHTNITIYEKPSQQMWENIKDITKRITFWLDAHFDGNTAAFYEDFCPLLKELDIIKQHSIKTHTILIDDVRLLGTEVFGYVTKDEVIRKIKEINSEYKIIFIDGHVENDILVAAIEKRCQMKNNSNIYV